MDEKKEIKNNIQLPQLKDVAVRPEPLHVLMVSPDHFDIVDVKNIHMSGNEGQVDKEKSRAQWQAIYDIYTLEKNNGNIDGMHTLPGAAGCEDMVFAANQSFPWIDEQGHKKVVMSRMRHESRAKEVPYFEAYYKNIGYHIIPPPGKGLLEGMGDLIPLPGRKLIFGGYGHRTDPDTLQSLSTILNTQIIPLKLVNESFYHLDTCFIPLNIHTALVVKEAFEEEDFKLIQLLFPEVIEIPLYEAEDGFALNAHVVQGHKNPFAIIQERNLFTADVLRQRGYTVYETDTSEYMKSGGSVFCMKMMHY